jgi:hypothetical protein
MARIYNRRFVLYAKSLGKAPEEVLEETRVEYDTGLDGANMSEFIIWISRQAHEFKMENPHGYIFDHEKFDEFLEKRFAGEA